MLDVHFCGSRPKGTRRIAFSRMGRNQDDALAAIHLADKRHVEDLASRSR